MITKQGKCPTPNGGVEWIIVYRDDYSMPCDESEASGYSFFEIDASGKLISDIFFEPKRTDNRKKCIGPVSAEAIRLYGNKEKDGV